MAAGTCSVIPEHCFQSWFKHLSKGTEAKLGDDSCLLLLKIVVDFMEIQMVQQAGKEIARVFKSITACKTLEHLSSHQLSSISIKVNETGIMILVGLALSRTKEISLGDYLTFTHCNEYEFTLWIVLLTVASDTWSSMWWTISLREERRAGHFRHLMGLSVQSSWSSSLEDIIESATRCTAILPVKG